MLECQSQEKGCCYDFVGLFYGLLLNYNWYTLDLQTEYYLINSVLALKWHVWVSLYTIKEI